MARKLFELFDETVKSGRDLIPSSPTTLADLSSSALDADAVKSKVDITNQVIHKVDYSDFKNFVFFNSALDYFNIVGENIINEFPYDGSYSDVLKFVSESDAYQRYLIDTWPRRSGSINLTSSIANSGTVPYVRAVDTEMLSGSCGVLGGTSSLTIELHVSASFPTTGTKVLFARTNISGDYSYGAALVSGGIDVFVKDVSGSSSDAFFSLSSGSGYYAIVLSSGTSGSVFVDLYGSSASHIATASLTSTSLQFDASPGLFLLGSGSVPVGFDSPVTLDGNINEVRVWNVSRTSAELKADYNIRAYANDNLLLYYRMCEGNTLSGSYSNIVLDYSGHKMNGVAMNVTQSAFVTSSVSSSFWSPERLGMSLQDDGEIVRDIRDVELKAFVNEMQTSGSVYDRNNSNIITRLVPDQYLALEDEQQTNVLRNLLYLLGRQFDETKVKIDQFVNVFKANYTNFNQTPDALLADALTFWGWTPKGSFLSNDAFEYFFGYNVLSGTSAEYDNQKLETELYDIKNQFWRRTLNNLIYLYKTKGTRESIESLLRIYGLDENIVRVKEFGVKQNAGIQTFRINSEKSAWAVHMSASMDPIYTTGRPISYVTASTVEMNLRFPSPNDTYTPTAMTGAVYHIYQSTDNRFSQMFAMPLGGRGDVTSSVEELYYTRELDSTTGTLWYSTSVSSSATSFVTSTAFGSFPIFNGQWYHLVMSKDKSDVTIEVSHLDDSVIDSKMSASIDNSSSTLSAGGYDFSLGGGGDAEHQTGEFWANEVRVWRQTLSRTEIDDHTLNPFSFGTDNPDRQNGLLVRWSFDKDIDDNAGNIAYDSSFPQINGIMPSGTTYDKFLFDRNFIAPPDYGWNEDKIRALDNVKDLYGDTFANNNAVSLEFNLIDALNEDASLLMSSLDNWNNVIGDPANRHRENYPVIEQLRAQYFSRLTGRLNFRVFADFLDFFDRSFIDLVAKLLPARANFKGAEFVVESHIYERPKVQYTYRRQNPTLVPEGGIMIYRPQYTITPSGVLG